ncbi:MAG: alanine racemase [Armatimonadota bacterium]
MRTAWVEVDLPAIRENIRAVQAFVGPRTGVMAVVKADAYGHGLIPAARAALAGGATMLGVALPEEVARLREAEIGAPVLILGCTLPEQAAETISLGASAVVSSLQAADALAAAARDAGTHARVHVKVDTGMGRVGVRWSAAAETIRRIAALPGLDLEGVMTHFAAADEADPTSSRTQFTRFHDVLEKLEALGIRPRFRHCANSAATVFLPESHLDLVRAGLLTYGIPPVPETENRPLPFPLRPALSLKAQVVQLSHLPAGDAVGYGHTYRARRDSVFALLPLGYADGLTRALSNRGSALVQGRRAPIAGRISMDQTSVDVTEIPGIALGDVAVLIGAQGEERITAWEVGLTMESIAYEALTNLSARLPRIYLAE